jgi:hypothetical protein
MGKSVYAEMATVDNGRFKQARRSLPRAAQQFVKLLQSERICGELTTGEVNRGISLSPVIPNGTFRPGHEVLRFLNR